MSAAPLIDDLVLPFQLEATAFRGRMVRLGPALDEILTRHDYPDPVAALLGETLVIAAALAGALKYEGIFTLQTKGDGPVSQMVADVSSDGKVRAHAIFDAARMGEIAAAPSGVLQALTGKGYLAFTVDQGADTERYQGIVDLEGGDMAECVQHYFRQSEQILTGLCASVSRLPDGRWRGGAIMIQKMPDLAPDSAQLAELPPEESTARHMSDESWQRTMLLLSTCKPQEMAAPDLPAADLLYRLFHEEGVRVYEPHALLAACRCSRARVERVLRALPQEEIAELKVDGVVTVTCEFCNRSYLFDDKDLRVLYAAISIDPPPVSEDMKE